jgi:hypothetical protein
LIFDSALTEKNYQSSFFFQKLIAGKIFLSILIFAQWYNRYKTHVYILINDTLEVILKIAGHGNCYRCSN